MSSHSTHTYRERGVAIIPARVREARAEAGLSLRKLAAGRLTGAAIHLIETGRARPSMSTLEFIAQRTGKPVTYFLAPGVELSERQPAAKFHVLERLALESKFGELLETAREWLQQTQDRRDRAALHIYIARAAAILGDGRLALESAADARQAVDGLGDDYLAADALAWEAVAFAILGDARARVAFDIALDAARRLPSPSAELETRILTNLALYLVSKQAWKEAIDTFGSAVRASENLTNLAAAARANEGLAHAYEATGFAARASRYLERALALYQMANNRAAEVRIRTSFAELLADHGRAEEASRQLTAAKEMFAGSELATGAARIAVAEARVAIALGATAEAEDLLAGALKLARKEADRYAEGEALRLQARRLVPGGGGYAAKFRAAIAVFSKSGLSERVVSTRRELAAALEADGDLAGALAELKRAIEAQPNAESEATGEVNRTA